MNHIVKVWLTGELYKNWAGKYAKKVGRQLIESLRYSGKDFLEAAKKGQDYCDSAIKYWTKNFGDSSDIVWQVIETDCGNEAWFVGGIGDLTPLPNGRPWTPRKPWIRKK